MPEQTLHSMNSLAQSTIQVTPELLRKYDRPGPRYT